MWNWLLLPHLAWALPIDFTADAASDVSVEIAVSCGMVVVSGGDREAVRVRGLTDPEVDVAFTGVPHRLQIVARSPSDGCAQLRIDVPADASVAMDVGSANVHVDGLRGGLDVLGDSSDVVVLGAPRVTAISVESGSVRLGASSDRVIRAGPVDVRSVSGNVRISGSLVPSSRIQASSQSGSVEVWLPDDTDALLVMNTHSATISSAFGPIWGRSVEQLVGHGGAEVILETVSGRIAVGDLAEE